LFARLPGMVSIVAEEWQSFTKRPVHTITVVATAIIFLMRAATKQVQGGLVSFAM